MKRRPGNGLAISKIFRILIVRLHMTGNPYWQRVTDHSPNLFYRRFFYSGKKFIRRTHRWDISFYTDILL